jgi:hypothetical protein
MHCLVSGSGLFQFFTGKVGIPAVNIIVIGMVIIAS